MNRVPKSILLSILLIPFFGYAQMYVGADTLYGHEWIDFSKTHFRIPVAKDGVYRISKTVLDAAGFPTATVEASKFRLYRYGQEERIYTTTDGLMGTSDFVEFAGKMNRSEVDYFLFDDPNDEMFSPWVSMYNDTAAYFMTYVDDNSQGLRYVDVPNDVSNPPAIEPYCWDIVEVNFPNRLIKRQISQYVNNSWYDGDGLGSVARQDHTFNISPRRVVSSAPNARATVRYFTDVFDHNIQLTIADSIHNTNNYTGSRVSVIQTEVPAQSLSNSTPIGIYELNTSNLPVQVIGVRIEYPRQFQFENNGYGDFWMEGGAGRFLEMRSISDNLNAPKILDATNGLRMLGEQQGAKTLFNLPTSATRRDVVLYNDAADGVTNVTAIEAVNFQDMSGLDASFLILTHPKLRQGANGTDPVQAYADYRSSSVGGNHSVEIVDVTKLYDMFAYGVHFHPIALRNFLHFFKKNSPSANTVLIVGKGLEADQFRSAAVQSALADSVFYVPSAGNPGSDWVYVLPNRLERPILSIGRIAAQHPNEIQNYLDKVKEQNLNNALPQTIEDRAWMKRVLHLSGGTSIFGQTALRFFLEGMEGILETNRFGADVESFYKTSQDPIQQSGAQRIQELVNDGVSLMTIFGHGAINTLDFDFGRAAEFKNKGRYPMIIGMGCFSGNCHTTTASVGEEFTLIKDKGALAFLATSSPGFSNDLNRYGRTIYGIMGSPENYLASMGDIMLATIDSLSSATAPTTISLAHQMIFQGDPAIRFLGQRGADYLIDNSSVQISPSPASIELDEVKITFDAFNIGENIDSALQIELSQRYPNDTLKTFDVQTISTEGFKTPFEFSLPKPPISATGVNRIFAKLDPNNLIDEQPSIAAEANNTIQDAAGTQGQELLFFADDVLPLQPMNYGIVTSPNPTLYASTFSPKTPTKRFLFEVDSTILFNSPLKKTMAIVQDGGLLSWTPDLNLQDSTVMYWRVSVDSLNGGDLPWRTASFVYLPNEPAGWNQSHIEQFAEGQLQNMTYNTDKKQLEFVDNAAFTYLWIGYYNAPNRVGYDNHFDEGYTGILEWKIRGIEQGVLVVLSSPLNGRYAVNPPGAPYNFDIDPTRANDYFYFDTRDPLQRVAMMNFLDNEVDDEDIVSILTYVNKNDTDPLGTASWGNDSLTFGRNLYQVLEGYGATQIRRMETEQSLPYGLIFQKNNPQFDVLEAVNNQQDTIVEIRAYFSTRWAEGGLATPVIGPATAWKSVHWDYSPFDAPDERVFLDVLAVREGQADSLLIRLLSQTPTTDLSFISPTDFPRLRLRVDMRDTTSRTPLPLRYLRVLYDGLPEGTVDAKNNYVFQKDTLQEGEKMSAAFDFKNISRYDMDSVLVEFRLRTPQNDVTVLQKRYDPLPEGQSLRANIDYDPQAGAGKYNLTAEVNPKGDQPEQHTFNNLLFQDFTVFEDDRNPLVDVTFDGQHIMDGDLVSPVPVILISLTDDNPFFALTDTATFDVEILRREVSNLLPFATYTSTDPEVTFTPATSAQDNKATFEVRPSFTVDGEYVLRVNGKDAAGNSAGNRTYEVSFQVITKSSLSNFLNYPNPFSSSTCFYYTLTGSEAPTDFKMQIMTVSGRIVREVSAAEFGEIRPGTHQSSFCWDGKDEFGDQLANGVYLYRIVAKKADGEAFELYDNADVDGFFKKGIGKMVLMR